MPISTSDGQYFEDQFALTASYMSKALGGSMSNETSIQSDMDKSQVIDTAVPRREAPPTDSFASRFNSVSEQPAFTVVDDFNSRFGDSKVATDHVPEEHKGWYQGLVSHLEKAQEFLGGPIDTPKKALIEAVDAGMLVLGGKGVKSAPYKSPPEPANMNISMADRTRLRQERIDKMNADIKAGKLTEDGQIIDPGREQLIDQSWRQMIAKSKKATDDAAKEARKGFKVIKDE